LRKVQKKILCKCISYKSEELPIEIPTRKKEKKSNDDKHPDVDFFR